MPLLQKENKKILYFSINLIKGLYHITVEPFLRAHADKNLIIKVKTNNLSPWRKDNPLERPLFWCKTVNKRTLYLL